MICIPISLSGIGNNSDHFRDAFFIEHLHGALDVRRARNVHRLQLGQIRQKAEAAFYSLKREAHLFEGALGFIRSNVIAVPDDKQIAWLIEFDREHFASGSILWQAPTHDERIKCNHGRRPNYNQVFHNVISFRL